MERNKKIIHLNNFIQSIPTAIINNNLLINNFSEIAKALTSHDYSAKVAIDIQSFIRFSNSKYSDYLPSLNIASFIYN